MIRALHTRTYIIGRSSEKSAVKASAYRSGNSVVAAAAYRANDKIKSDNDGRTHDYTRKKGVVFSQIILPARAPERFKNRSVLWNEVERVEYRKNSQFARQWEASFPPEFDRQDQLEMLVKFAQDYFVGNGMVADIALHDKGEGNPHAHILLTLRRVDENGFIGNKERIWNDRKFAELWRLAWAERCNEIYKKMELPTRIDPRTYELQQNGLIPTKPIGKAANQLEKQGIRTRKGDENRRIEAVNARVKQNSFYDVATIQSQKETEKVDYKETYQNVYQDQRAVIRELKTAVKEKKATYNDLLEIYKSLDDMEVRALESRDTGDVATAKKIEQSMTELRDNLQNEYGITSVQIEETLSHVADEIMGIEKALGEILQPERDPAAEGDKAAAKEREVEHDR